MRHKKRIKMWIFFFILILSSCSTFHKVTYIKEKNQYGYSDSSFQSEVGQVRVVSFKGDARTSRKLARKLAYFRSLEVCWEQDKKHVNILEVFDRSFEKVSLQADVTSPHFFYGFGTFPYYSRYSSWGIGADVNLIDSRSMREFIFYPWIEMYFLCSQVVESPLLKLRNIPRENMFHLVKDLRGGIQITGVNQKTHFKKSIHEGDVIIAYQNKRIDQKYLFLQQLQWPHKHREITFLRDGKKMKANLQTQNVTEKIIEKEKHLLQFLCHHKKMKLKKRKICQDFLKKESY